MIRHGASQVFAGIGEEDGEINVDIDKLLAEGQEKTDEMDKQMDGN